MGSGDLDREAFRGVLGVPFRVETRAGDFLGVAFFAAVLVVGFFGVVTRFIASAEALRGLRGLFATSRVALALLVGGPNSSSSELKASTRARFFPTTPRGIRFTAKPEMIFAWRLTFDLDLYASNE